MAIGGVCRWLLVVFGSTRPKQNLKQNPARLAGFSVGDIRPGFCNFFFDWADNESFAAVTYVTRGAQIRFFFVGPTRERLERAPPISA